jgi:hypothetical protein
MPFDDNDSRAREDRRAKEKFSLLTVLNGSVPNNAGMRNGERHATAT